MDFPESLVHVAPIPEGVTEVILASDGYPEIRRAPERQEEPDPQKRAELDLRATEALLAYVHTEDPLMINLAKAVRPNNPPPMLSHDDRSFISVDLPA